jgi:hypothetical protein
MAEELAEKLPQNSESTMCMRKLLEARDCAMRSAFFGGVAQWLVAPWRFTRRSEGGSEGGWITFRTKCGSRGTAHRTRAVSNREVLSSTMTLSVQHRHGVRLAGPAVAVGFGLGWLAKLGR